MCTFSNLLSPALKVANKLMEKSRTLIDTLITNINYSICGKVTVKSMQYLVDLIKEGIRYMNDSTFHNTFLLF